MAIDPYTEAIQEAFASAPDNVVLLETIELNHPSWISPHRFVNDFTTLSAYTEPGAPNNPGEEVQYLGMSFSADLPDIGEAGVQALQLKIDNVSLLIFQAFQEIDWSAGEVTMIYREYTTADLSEPGRYHYTVVKGITVTEEAIVASCSYSNYLTKLFPSKRYDSTNWPGTVV